MLICKDCNHDIYYCICTTGLEHLPVNVMPKLKRDWIGRSVKLLRDLETKNGTIFPVGTVMKVTRNFAGLHLEYIEVCEHCRAKGRVRIHNVPEYQVELLP